ncbi:MAG: hypothetical protein ACRDG4_14790 [Chloroflexota bacterium]
MTITDYIVDILLIAIIFRQMQTRELTPRSILLPVILIVIAGVNYLHPFALGGNDIALIALLTGAGIVIGTLSGLATSVWRGHNGSVVARAGILAAATWVLGMGFRFAFAVYAGTATGDAAIGRFSAQHAITNGQTWTTALVLMAFGEVLARVAILQLRRLQVSRAQTEAPRMGHMEARQALFR